MHKLQEQTVTQIIIPFVQMIIPFSHLWNGKKKKKKRVKHCLYSSTGKSQGLITKAGEVLVIIPMQSSHLSSNYKAFFFLQWINRNENCVIIAP